MKNNILLYFTTTLSLLTFAVLLALVFSVGGIRQTTVSHGKNLRRLNTKQINTIPKLIMGSWDSIPVPGYSPGKVLDLKGNTELIISDTTYSVYDTATNQLIIYYNPNN